MKTVIQRVKSASVSVSGEKISEIKFGVLTLLGVEKGDDEATLEKLISKIINLRIFEDENSKMNKSLKDVAGSHLIVSQFTLLGDCSKGNRPSFIAAESPDRARELYEKAIAISKSLGVDTQGGKFQAHMEVNIINDGPVTLVLGL